MAEEGKIALRNIRQDANNSIKNNTEFTEDDKDRYIDDVQELINKYNKKVDEVLSTKEKELMEI